MSFSKIRILNEVSINQIAAGEVIENAASVVKELVENAIDAKATSIHITTKAGGRQLISVKDNGCGMNRDDLDLCIERHATSKIITSADIYKLSTLGFRGEALATIASISKMKIVSSINDTDGLALFVEGGKKIETIHFARAPGTTVEVANLFYNVPVRKHFQKSLAADTLEIHKQLLSLALSHPHIGFGWVHDELTQFAVVAGKTRKERIEELLGSSYCQDLIELEVMKHECALCGFIGLPHTHRPNKSQQNLFVNGRSVTSSFIAQTVLKAFGERLPTSRFPLYTLYLTTPPEVIDVNIHPRKKELRFQNEEEIEELVLSGVKNALESHYEPFIAPKIAIAPMLLTMPLAMPVSLAQREEEKIEEVKNKTPRYSLIHTMGDYLFVAIEEEIFVIEQKRARERIFFDKFSQGQLFIQHLLFPISIEMSPPDFRLIEGQIAHLQTCGIGIRIFGKTSFVIDALPEIFDENEVENLLHFLVDELKKNNRCDVASKIGLNVCKSILRKEFSREESLKIVESLLSCKESSLSPLGQPIYFKITNKEIAKWLS